MIFKTFTWPNDPKHLNLSIIKNSKIYCLPNLGPTNQQLGYNYRVIEGFGEFFGPECYNQFGQLSKTFIEPSSGPLSIPNLPPIKAFFSELSITGSPGPNIISYKFKFIEDISNINRPNTSPSINFYYIKENENLWDVANKFNLSIDTLLKKNPCISNPYDVFPGIKVITQ